jgi:hypothetical protein
MRGRGREEAIWLMAWRGRGVPHRRYSDDSPSGSADASCYQSSVSRPTGPWQAHLFPSVAKAADIGLLG